MKKTKFQFIGTDNHKLMAELDFPEGEIKYYALYAPCFTCTKNLRAIKYIAQSLNQHGIALLRFDFPGIGESEGNFSDSTFTTNLENIRIAYKLLSEQYEAPKLLIGHSLGGAAMMRLVMEFDSVKAIVAVASADNPAHLADKLWRARDNAKINGHSNMNIGGTEYKLTDKFFEDLYKNGETHDLKSITKPVLTLHSPDDDTIEYKYAIKNFTEPSGQNSYIELNNVGHLMNKPADAKHIGNLIATWSLAYCS